MLWCCGCNLIPRVSRLFALPELERRDPGGRVGRWETGNDVVALTALKACDPLSPKTLTLRRCIVSYYVYCRFAKQCLNLFEQRRPRPQGGTPRKIGWRCAARFPKPLPYFDQNLRYSLPYLWPDQKFETLFMTWPLNQNPVSDLRYD